MTGIPLPRTRLRKGATGVPARVAELVAGRSAGICEICMAEPATEIHHRQLKGMGGTRRPEIHDPSNLLDLGQRCHRPWVHANPANSEVAGWIVPDWRSPLTTPVWTVQPFPSWSLLLDEDAMVQFAYERDPPHPPPPGRTLPMRPDLPPHADLSAIGAASPRSKP